MADDLTYPLAAGPSADIAGANGTPLSAITLAAVRDGSLTPADVRIAPHTLELQAGFAEAGGNAQLADNLRRGAELIAFNDDELLALYEALRPGRSSATELDELATRLDARGAARCATLVREARAAYVRRAIVS